MNNYELLDLIGEACEDYVLEADRGAARPRPRWNSWAAAACAALALCTYSLYTAAVPSRGEEQDAYLPLHGYTVAEGGGALAENALEGIADQSTAGGADKAASPAGTAVPAPAGGPMADAGAPAGEEGLEAYSSFADPVCGASADAAKGTDPVPGLAQGAPIADQGPAITDQETAIAQYQRLVLSCGLADDPPAWYAGAWLDCGSPCRLAVSVVEGFHTPELEARIEEWCGGGVVFVQDGKYSYAHLLDMQEQVIAALMDPGQDETWSAFSSMAPSLVDNCLEVNFYGLPSDGALAFLARLDPEGDAIRVQAFAAHAVTDELPHTAEPTPAPRLEKSGAASAAPCGGEEPAGLPRGE